MITQPTASPATVLRRTWPKVAFALHVRKILKRCRDLQALLAANATQGLPGQTGEHAALAHRGRLNPLLAHRYVRIALRDPLTKETYLYAILPVIHVSSANQASIL